MFGWRFRIGIWVALLLVFAGIYWYLGPGPGPKVPAGTSPFGPTYFLLLFGLFLVLFAVFFGFVRWGSVIANRGSALAHQGRYVEALVQLERARKILRRTPVLPYWIGSVRLALWQLDQAETELAKANHWRLSGDTRFAVTPVLALVHALKGKVAEAESDLQAAAARGVAEAPSALTARMVLASRAGRWEEVIELGGRSELRNLGGSTRGLLDALRAWSREKVSGTPQSVDVVAVTGEVAVDRVRAAWPELAEFLERAKGS